MNTKTTFALIALLAFGFSARCQDYILKLSKNITTVYCKNISVDDDIVNYLDTKDSTQSSIPINDIYCINFYKEKPDEILLFSLQLDTIKCLIESIGINEIYYRAENNLLKIVDKNDVFCVQFNELISDNQLNIHLSKFLELYKNSYSENPKLIKNNGSKFDINKLVSIKDDTIEIQLVSQGERIVAFTKRSDIKSYINIEPINKGNINLSQNFLLSKKGTLWEVTINEIQPDIIDINIIIDGKLVRLDQAKNAVAAIIFYNYKVKDESNPEEKAKKGKVYNKNPTFDFSAGIGYINNDTPEGLSAEEKKYIDDLRLGFSLDANLRFFITHGFGVGIKYNQFSTNNSVPNIVSDNIIIRFFGGTLFGNIPIKDIGFINLDFSAGYLSESNNGEYLGQTIQIKAHTFGIYASGGVGIFIFKRVVVELSCGIAYGTFNEIVVNTHSSITLDKPDALNRIDMLAGFKFYL